MRRWLVAAMLVVAALVGLVVWLEDDRVALQQSPSSDANGVVPEAIRQSKWNEPIVARGSRRLSGVVLRDGAPYSGAVVTALQAHGDEVLSDLPCACDNHCGQKLLQCGCAEAAGQLVDLVGGRTGEAVPLGRATTASDGTFVIEGLDDSKLTLWADATNGIAWKTDVASDATDVKLELQKGRLIKGTVKTTEGTPASGALVTAIFSEQSRFFEVAARADGTFEIGPVPKGDFAVVAMQTGFLPDHTRVRADKVDDLKLELSVPRVLSGVVKKDDAPVPGATVKLEGMHRKRTVTSDAQGAFRVEALKPGEYELNATSTGALGSATALVNKREDRDDVVITLEDGVPLDGVVVDERGAPVSAAKVQAETGSDWQRAETGDDGRFHFDVVKTGELSVWVTKEGFLQLESEKVTGGATPVRLTLTRAAMVSGSVVTADGKPVTNFTVNASLADAGDDVEARMTAGASDRAKSTDGGFSLALRAGQTYELDVEPEAYGSTTVVVEAPREGLVIVVKEGAVVRGQVFGPDSKPASGASVRAMSKDDMKHVEADDEGRFTLAGLGAGEWKLAARNLDPKNMWMANATVTLASSGTTEVTLRAASGASISGVVIDDKGTPAANVGLSAMTKRAETEAPAFETTTSAADGSFSFKTMPAGPVTIRAQRAGGPPLDIVAPDTNVIVKLAVATTVSGRVVDDKGKPVTEFRVLHRPVDDKEGKFSMPARVGKMQVAVDAQGFAQQMMEVDVKEGANDLGVIKLTRGVSLTGVVRDAETGQPIAGALVDVSNVEPKNGFLLATEYGAATTDKQGRYSLKVDPTSTWVAVSHRSYEPVAKSRGSATNFDVKLMRGGVLTVTVVDDKNQPVRDAFVVASKGMERTRFTPSASGTFVAEGIAPGSWTLSVMGRRLLYKAQTVEVTREPMRITVQPAKTDVEILLMGDASLNVVLVNGPVKDVKAFPEMMGTVTTIPARVGTPVPVFAGEWTAVMVRGGEAAVQSLGNVKEAVQVELKPQWQSAPMFGR
ncbi:MAG: carboxypeptidase regulatory-like domain-containing protein [Archangium sp.]